MKSIETVLPITRVPNALPYVKGVVNLRGVITPIIDFRTRFNIEEKEYTNTTRILITILDDIEVGFIVDAANDVIDILEENIENNEGIESLLNQAILSASYSNNIIAAEILIEKGCNLSAYDKRSNSIKKMTLHF